MRTHLVHHLSYAMAHALSLSPDGETAEELMQRWERDDDRVIELPGPLNSVTRLEHVTLTNHERDAVLSRTEEILSSLS
jgi:hypothetical protein